MEIAQPDEVYNLGAISFVGLSWRQAELTGDVTRVRSNFVNGIKTFPVRITTH